MKKTTRLLCWMITIMMVLGSLPIGAIAQDAAASATNATSTAQVHLGPGEKTTAELQNMQIHAQDIPELIPMQRAEEKGHVNRLRVQEQGLHTVIYQNRDGDKSTYLFARPVKYIDAAGAVRDKSTALSIPAVSGVAYAMEDNDVKAYFSTGIGSGVLLSYEDYTIRMIPQMARNASAIRNEDNDTVVYTNVFGTGTHLVYEPGMYGIKEDIVLAKDTGNYSFSFRLETAGLTLVQDEDGWVFQNAEEEEIARFEEIVIRDAEGKSAIGSVAVTGTGTAGVYTVTVTAPQAFMQASDTAYPVYIDPTTTITYDHSRSVTDEYGDVYTVYYRSIVDTSYYTTTDAYDGVVDINPDLHAVGNGIGGNGSGFIVYQFADFYDVNGRFIDLENEEILSATLYLPVEENNYDIAVYASPMTSRETPAPMYSGAALDSSELYGSWSSTNRATSYVDTMYGLYSIDFTQIARGWVRYNKGLSTAAYENPQNGFALHTDANAYRYVAQADSAGLYGDTVYCVIDTQTASPENYLVNDGVTKFLTHSGTSLSYGACSPGTTAVCGWNLNYLGDDTYTITTMDSAYTGYALQATATGVTMSALPTTVTNAYKWQLEYEPYPGTPMIRNLSTNTYLCVYESALTLKSMGDLSGTTDYYNAFWRVVPVADQLLPTEVTLSGNTAFELGGFTVLNTVENSDDVFYGNNSDYVWTTSNSKFSITENGTVTYNQLSAGNTTITVTHKLTGITATRVIESGMEWESSTYLVEDFGENNLFLNVNDDTANVDQYDSTEKMCWIFDKVSGSNLYTIKNKYNNKYLGVENHAAVEGAKLVFYEDSTGASCKWLLSPYGNKEPSYRIASSQDPTLLLAFPPGTNFGDQVLLLPESKIYSKGWNLYLERYEKSMTVRNYYDDGYLTRATVDQIYSDFIETMRFYIKNWGIRLIMAETTYYDPDVTPASDGSYSKTALTNQFREDFGYGTYNDIKIYWSCYKIMNGSQLAYSHTVPEQYIIFMFEPEHENVSEQVAVKTFHRILIHEMYHQFGILDHYHETRQPLDENGKCKNNPRCKTCNIQSAYSEDCCMNSQSATKYKLFCNTCRTELETYLKNTFIKKGEQQ